MKTLHRYLKTLREKKTHLSSNKFYIKINSELGAKLQKFSANFTSELSYEWYVMIPLSDGNGFSSNTVHYD